MALVVTIFSPAYAGSSLCEANEVTVWSCETKKKTFSLCASGDLDTRSGYMQYRAAHYGKISLRYPEALRHPRGIFTLEYLARDGKFSFTNGGYYYEIIDLLVGSTAISINRNNRQVAEIECGRADPSILDNASIDVFRSAGLRE